MKKNKIKNLVIHKLGGYTECDVDFVESGFKAKIHEINTKHEEFVKIQEVGYELAHRKDGSGVASLIREILFDTIQETLGDRERPAPGVKRADIIETDEAVWDWSDRVADDIRRFCEGIAERNSTCVRWGVPNCRCGIKTMMGMSAGRIDSPLGRFARIWRKEHPDTRMKDVLDDDRQKRWSKFDKTVKAAINFAVQSGMTFWK